MGFDVFLAAVFFFVAFLEAAFLVAFLVTAFLVAFFAAAFFLATANLLKESSGDCPAAGLPGHVGLANHSFTTFPSATVSDGGLVEPKL